MKLYYRVQGCGIEIIRCLGNDASVLLPEKIHGIPVTKVAPYTFSNYKDEEDTDCKIYETEENLLSEDDIYVLAGEQVEEIIFPDTVCEIGNYIFYGCRNLTKLEFSNSLRQIGSGAFTGCRALSVLKVHMKKGKKSCVKEILGELWQRIDVTFLYEKENERADLVFPQHYEEAVENTPARMLYTQHHGSGNNYRQCFYNHEMDYRKYDSLFALAKVFDKPEVLADIALKRLRYSYDLAEKSRLLYEGAIRERYREIVEYLITEERFESIRLLSEKHLWDIEMIDYALEIASGKEKTELLSYLMDEKLNAFGSKRKVFKL